MCDHAFFVYVGERLQDKEVDEGALASAVAATGTNEPADDSD